MLAATAAVSTTACTSQTRKPQPETISMQQDVRELVSAQKALTSRLGMLADRLSRMEDRLSVQEARVNVSLPELPVVKLVAKTSPKRPEQQSPTAITQGDVESTRTEIPRIRPRRAKPTAKRRPPRVVTNSTSRTKMKAAAQPEPTVTEPKGMISQATQSVNERRYDEALSQIGEFHRLYPRNALRQYALLLEGRAHFGKGATDRAIKKFEDLIAEFPSGRTVPDALYLIGLSQDRLGQTHRAVETLARLKTIYPATEAGKRAAAALSDRQQSL